VVRNYDYTPFDARQARPTPLQTLNMLLSRGFIPGMQVEFQLPASATLRFEDFSLASCGSVAILDEEYNLLQRLLPGQPSSFQTEVLPAQGSSLSVWLESNGCPDPSSLTLAEVQPAWGRARQTELSGYDSPNPYPAAGYSVTLSLPSDMESHLLIYSALASCDTLEVRRTGTGEVLWSWPYDAGIFRSAWTPALSGDVDVGIWSSQGCNQTERGFSVRRLYTRLPPGAPANLHLPGQRALSPSASSRRGAFHEPEADLLENWHRIYQPATGRYFQPEPLLRAPAFIERQVLAGHTAASYAYALNSPANYTDSTGLEIELINCSQNVKNIVKKLKQSLRKTKDCRCTKILQDNGITDQILEETIYYITYHKDKIPNSKKSACGQAYAPEMSNDISISTRKECMSPAKLIAHELRHSGPYWIPHGPNDSEDPIFLRIEECINNDGTIKTD